MCLITRFRQQPHIVLAPLIILSLTLALWGGLLRIGWHLPPNSPHLVLLHAPLMIAGFFATVIGLERAVALRRTWMFAAPLATTLSSLSFLVLGINRGGMALLIVGALVLCTIFGVLMLQHPAIYTATMGLAALCWLGGNVLWLLGRSIPEIALWWTAFLVLTIAGERLELGRLLRLPGSVQGLFSAIIAMQMIGLIVILVDYRWGLHVIGGAWLMLAVWLLRHDIARRTIRKTGLTRFIAVCMLSGYVWLGVGGMLGLLTDGSQGGFRYDAQLHSVFVGFVFSMIFGHAPIIIPALLKITLTFSPRFYWHVWLLHLSLTMRVIGDLLLNYQLRRWAGMLNVSAIILFVGMTVIARRKARS